MKIICIGRNYSEHAKELNNSVPDSPLFFMKPDSALNKTNVFFYPEFTHDLHYEVEIVVKINKVGKHISERFTHKYYSEIGLGIDFTARDLQKNCKENGLPWEVAKSFDGAALISPEFIPLTEIENLSDVNFSLKKNNELVQIGNTKDMIFSVNQLVSYLSKFMTFKKGDLIYTGTPAGVGSVQLHDELTGYIEDKKMFHCRIK